MTPENLGSKTPEQRAAQIWCKPYMASQEMDVQLAELIAAEIQAAVDEALCNENPDIDESIDAAYAKGATEGYKRGVSAGRQMAEDAIKKSEEKAEVCAREYHRICEGWEEALAEEREECAKICEGDVLQSPDEFEGKTKLKVFDLLERLAATIRARTGEEKKI